MKRRWTKKQLIEAALAAIEQHHIAFFDELPALLPVSRSTLYQKKINESDAIKDALGVVRIKQKRHLRARWNRSPHPTTDIALYKLMADDDELERLQPKQHKVALSQDPDGAPLIPDHVARMIDKAYADEAKNKDNEGAEE